MNEKPLNLFRKKSLAWILVDGYWEDLTIPQIAEVLGRSTESIRVCFGYIKKRSGYIVPYRKRTKRSEVQDEDAR